MNLTDTTINPLFNIAFASNVAWGESQSGKTLGVFTNNDYFNVERSDDGKDFITIGKVQGYGNGTTTEAKKYSFTDHEKCDDVRYYRLKQVDIDGEYSYTGPVAVNCRRVIGLELYPNPAKSIITYKFYNSENSELNLNILDAPKLFDLLLNLSFYFFLFYSGFIHVSCS